MRTKALFFVYFLLGCQTTESFTLKRVILGGNVTLDCELDNNSIYWLFMKPSESLVMIFRTFTSDSTKPLFFDQRLKSKYSSTTSSRLCISNMTKDELGIYYCVKTHQTALQLSNGTKLYTTETFHRNSTEGNDLQHHEIKHQTVAITSISCIAIFLIIIGLFTLKCGKPRKIQKQPYPNFKVKQFDDLNTKEFTKVEFRLCE